MASLSLTHSPIHKIKDPKLKRIKIPTHILRRFFILAFVVPSHDFPSSLPSGQIADDAIVLFLVSSDWALKSRLQLLKFNFATLSGLVLGAHWRCSASKSFREISIWNWCALETSHAERRSKGFHVHLDDFMRFSIQLTCVTRWKLIHFLQRWGWRMSDDWENVEIRASFDDPYRFWCHRVTPLMQPSGKINFKFRAVQSQGRCLRMNREREEKWIEKFCDEVE